MKFMGLPLISLGLVVLVALAYGYLKQAAFLKVEQVIVQGTKRLSLEEVAKTAGIKPGDSFLGIKPRKLVRRLKKHTWIKEASVRTIPPGKLIITVKEREPVALLKSEKLFYLDSQGYPFKEVAKGEPVDYPVVTGVNPSYPREKDAKSAKIVVEALTFLQESKEFDFPALENISELNVTEAYGLTFFTMTEGLEIRLGNPPYQDKLWRLNQVIKMQPRELKSARYVDVSFSGQVVFGH